MDVEVELSELMEMVVEMSGDLMEMMVELVKVIE